MRARAGTTTKLGEIKKHHSSTEFYRGVHNGWSKQNRERKEKNEKCCIASETTAAGVVGRRPKRAEPLSPRGCVNATPATARGGKQRDIPNANTLE